jgi:hypothetical protein
LPDLKPNQNENSEPSAESFPVFSPKINFLIQEIVSLGGYDDLKEVINSSEVPPLPILEARVMEVRDKVYKRVQTGPSIN